MASSAGEYSIRRATAQDSEALYRVCLLTGDSGKDGTQLYRDDPKALGEVASRMVLERSYSSHHSQVVSTHNRTYSSRRCVMHAHPEMKRPSRACGPLAGVCFRARGR